ncbi:MAG: hypothetical protein HFH09_04050 [Bacilli bacterium]|nr:hypothetical protein [Bacilli bacterium]
MKVLKNDGKDVVIFLPASNIFLDRLKREELEDYFKTLFLKLEDRYGIDHCGFYQIYVYKDSYYGAILEIEEEDLPYLDYIDNEVEMNIHIPKDTSFMYQLEDILDLDIEILKASNLYYYQNRFYIELKREVQKKNYLQLLEYGELIYGEKVKKVQRSGKLFSCLFCE